MNAAERRHVQKVVALRCAIGLRFGGPCSGKLELHHVAEGSSKRSWYAVVPLCAEHHRGGSGLHGMGVKAFCRLYRVPWEKEEGLLLWTNEDLART